MKNKCIFLDRDGVINESLYINGASHPPRTASSTRIISGIHDVLAMLMKMGYRIVVFTNQPDIARKLQTQEEVDKINGYLFNELPIDKIYVCPHDDSDNCNCRKPKIGMLLEAQKEYGINFSKSFVVGDRWSDMVAGETAGCQTIFVDYGYKEIHPFTYDYKIKDVREILEIINNDKNIR